MARAQRRTGAGGLLEEVECHEHAEEVSSFSSAPLSLPAFPFSSASFLLGFGAAGVAVLAPSCPGLTGLDLSNGVDLGDAAAAEVARAKGLRRLSLARWKPLTDMGVGCVAVGCAELRELSLKWCLGVSDLGIQLLALKCRKLRSLLHHGER